MTPLTSKHHRTHPTPFRARSIGFWVLCIAAMPGCFAAQAEESVNPTIPEGREMLREISRRFSALEQLSYQANLVSRLGRENVTRTFQFSYQPPDRIRVEHIRPEERLLVLNGETLVEFIPAARTALKTDLGALSESSRQSILRNTLSRSVVEGLRIGEVDGLLNRISSISAVQESERTVWILEGRDPFFRLRLEPERYLLLETELHDGDGPLLVTRASNFTEVLPGFWLPRRLQNRNRSPRGMVENVYTLEDIQVNQPFPDRYFHFTLPRGARWHTP